MSNKSSNKDDGNRHKDKDERKYWRELKRINWVVTCTSLYWDSFGHFCFLLSDVIHTVEEEIINKVINSRKSLYVFLTSVSFPPILNIKIKK